MIAEIQVLPSPLGTAEDRYAHVDAAIAVIAASGLAYEVGALGTTVEGPPAAVWALARAAHELTLAAGVAGVVTVLKLAEGAEAGPDSGPSIDDLVGGHRPWNRAGELLRRYGPPAALLVLAVLAWEAWVVLRDTPAYLLPSPGRVAGAFADSSDLLPRHVVATAVEAVVGLAIGAAAGVAVALVLASSEVARRTLEPLLVASQTIPMFVLAPLLVIWFGIGPTPKVLVVALITFFPVAIDTAAGLAGADPEQIELLRSMGATSRQQVRLVRIPAAVPGFFTGLRVATAYAVAGAVIGELVAGDRGLGVFINRSRASFRVDRIFVAVVLVAVLSAVLFALVGALARRAMPWRERPTASIRTRLP